MRKQSRSVSADSCSTGSQFADAGRRVQHFEEAERGGRRREARNERSAGASTSDRVSHALSACLASVVLCAANAARAADQVYE